MKIKGQTLKQWKEWLNFQLQPNNPENLKNDEKYVLEAFLELIQKVDKNN